MESTGIQAVTGKKDPVTLEAGQSYARANVSVDFSGVTFKEPGIYGYKITENADNTGTITNDAKTARYMYVYVEDDGSGNLSVKGYVLYGNPIKSADGESGEWIQEESGWWYHPDETKSEGFVNTMNGKGLSITKQVSGNQASHDEYFKFTLNIAHALPNTTYSVDLSKADATTQVTGVNADIHNNAATITNKKSGTIPTGVVMAVAPFAVATLFGGAGAATIVMKKRKANGKEDENE